MNQRYLVIRKYGILTGMLVSAIFFLISCESEYNKLVRKEMSKGEVYEELFFDLKIGQSRKDFYAICWDLNAEKVISQGPGNNFAKYIIQQPTPKDTSKIEMLFYGIFDEEDVMIGMDMRMSFLSYAPWNENSHSTRLIEVLKEKYRQDYPGNDFLQIELEEGYGDAWVKVDGSRQIVMYPISQKDVVVKIEDLRYKALDS